MDNVILGSLEAIDQLKTFIADLGDDAYTAAAQPLFSSTIGQHVRHILDVYQPLMQFSTDCELDYDKRRRGGSVETNREQAIAELDSIGQWLLARKDDDFTQNLSISTEVMLTRSCKSVLASSLGREICFASSHLTHHFAVVVAIAKFNGLEVDPSLGLAPGTASHLRSADRSAA